MNTGIWSWLPPAVVTHQQGISLSAKPGTFLSGQVYRQNRVTSITE